MAHIPTPEREALRDALRICATGLKWAAVFGLFINAMQLVVPLYMLQIYDRVVNSRSVDTLTMLTLLALTCLLFLASLDMVRTRVFLAMGEAFARKLSRATLQAAVTRALQTSPAQSSQPMRDLYDLRQFVVGGPLGLPIDALFSPLFLALLFVLHPAYGAVAVCAMAVLLVLGVVSELAFRRRLGAANEATLRSHAEAGAAVRHAETIEALGMLGAVARRWERSQHEALRRAGRGEAGMRAIAIASRGFRMAIQIVMLGTGAYLVINDATSAGTIVASTIIMSRALFPFEQLIEGWRQWSHAIEAHRRLRELLGSGSQGRELTRHEAMSARLTVDRVGYLPPQSDRPVLKGISFEVEPGEVLKIEGHSGAGKSTLARMLVGVVRPTQGGVYLDGHNVYTWEREGFGAAVGYLSQFANLLDGTVGENIARMGDVDPADIVAAARRVGAHEMIGRLPFGYDTVVGEGGFNLSGGQRQRIALARAFFRSPKFIVLDEPGNHLDTAGLEDLKAAIAASRAEGTTVVVITHQANLAQDADKLLVLADGTVEAFGRREVPPERIEGNVATLRQKGGALARVPVKGLAS